MFVVKKKSNNEVEQVKRVLGFCTRESKRKKFEINKYVSIFRSNSYGSRILRLTQLLLLKYLC